MKIVLFINTLSSGGAEHQMCYLANFLEEEGHDVTITTYGDMPDHYDLNDRIKRKRIAPNEKKWQKAFSIFYYFLKIKCDVVISFCQDNSLLAIPGLFVNRKPKLIVGERNTTIGGLTRLENILFRFLYSRAKYIVPNSHSQQKHIIEYAPKLKFKTNVVINYTDTSCFTPISINNLNSVKNICVFARYAKQKNYKRFCEAIKILKTKEYHFHIDWYGSVKMPNSNINTDYLEFTKLIKDNQLENFITLHDSIKNVQQKLKQYDAFCLPSIHEGFSNSLSEAICTGLPILASNISDNPYMVKDGKNGFSFNPHDVSSIVNAFEKMFQVSIEDLRNMSNASVEIANSLFSKKKFIESYNKMLFNCLNMNVQ